MNLYCKVCTKRTLGIYSFHMVCKEGQFDVVMVNNQFKAFTINLNAQHVSGMTHFDLALT